MGSKAIFARAIFTGGSAKPQRWASGAFADRHTHDHAYAAVVLSGGYDECGSHGRFRVGPGVVLVHGLFETHLDRFARSGAEVFNVVLPSGMLPRFALGRLADPDLIVRSAENDRCEAAELLCADLVRKQPRALDWPDVLAAQLQQGAVRSLGDWAAAHGLAQETLSRGFHTVFGVPPSQFRSEARTRLALLRLAEDRSTSLADIAAETGFSDQAHMSRAVRKLTGRTPRHWRRTSNPFKTGLIGSG